MADDPIIAGAHRRGLELIAAERRAQTLLAEYQADNNEEGIAEAIGDLAAIRSQGIALNQLHNEHVARNSPQPQGKRQSIMNSNKPIEDYTIEDQLEIINHERRDKLTADDLHKAIADNQVAWNYRQSR